MTRTRKMTFAGMFVALLIGSQFALSALAGVEIVTPLLLAFCVWFGVGMGVLTASTFSLLRCLIFGFTPPVMILYLIYFNLFAVLFGLVGRWARSRAGVHIYVVLTLLAVVSTAVFTLLDNVITPVFYGFSVAAMQAYFVASVAVLVPHLICVTVACPVLLPPLFAICRRLPREETAHHKNERGA